MKPNVHIVPYTHWDREFRWEFEHTRMKLVECFDHLLDIMTENPEYKHFHLDGQIGLLVDYLEIRPEREAIVRELIAQDRLEIGPWYTLPDCGTLNGESVIRNLQHGVKVTKTFGDVLPCGYNVFSFGQIAQLPQIYAHFGIDMIIFYKHMNKKRSKLPEFIWEAPDGTRAFASRLGREARWNFTFAATIPIVYDRDPWHRDWRYEYGSQGKVVHTADPEGYGFFHEILDPDTSFHEKNLDLGFERALETVTDTAAPETLLMFDGTDFLEPHPLFPEILSKLRERFGDRYHILHSKLETYLAELREILERKKDDLEVVRGPMRDGPVGAVHSDVLTIHPELKLANAEAENRLIRSAEPLSTAAWAMGIDAYPHAYFAKAWKLLFESHAHDSVHGLGPRELGEGQLARLRQANQVVKAVERKALNNLTKEIDVTEAGDGEIFLAVHNAAAFPRTDFVEAWIDIPAEHVIDEVRIEDLDGTARPVQELGREKARAGTYHARNRNMPFDVTRVNLLFDPGRVPALGHKTFRVAWTPRRDYPYPHDDWDPVRVIVDDMLIAPRAAHGDRMELSIADDGSFSVTELESGRTYDRLHTLLDAGDRGNMWMADPPDRDELIHSAGRPAEISCVRHGPLEAVFEIRQTLPVPARFDFAAQRRSAERVDLVVTSRLRLRRNGRAVEVRTTVDNTARDHMLKVCFPTGLQAKTTCADGSYSVTEYSASPDLSTELARHPAQLWFDLREGDAGLAILSRSTKDYEILPDHGTCTMAMGLLRGVRLRIPCDNRLWMEYPGDESAQSLGTTVHEYAVLPHRGGWDEDGIYREALAFNQPLRPVQFARQAGALPSEFSFLEIEDPNVVLSSVTAADDRRSVLVRMFNPTPGDIQTDLKTGFDVRAAHVLSLAGERGDPLSMDGRSVSLDIGKGKIYTVELELREAS
jgi:mannosylglycerate hydrolase